MEKIFCAFFEKSISPSAVSAGPEQRFLFVNEAWVRLFGFSKEEAIGKNAEELGVIRDPAAMAEISRQLDTSGNVTEAPLVLYDKSGTALHVLNNIARMTLDGEVYVLSSLHDVTNQKLAEMERHQHDASLLDELTRRERDVLKLALAGHSNKDIAVKLGISYRTVEVHRSHCIRKLGTRSLIQIKLIAESGHL